MTDRWVRRWEVPSDSSDRVYTVATDRQGRWGCTCPHYKFRHKECKHIRNVKDGNGQVMEEPGIILANVQQVTLEEDGVWCPLIPIGDTHFQATVIYDLLKAGVRWSTLKDRYSLADRNPREAIIDYVEQRGRAIYTEHIEGRGWTGRTIMPVT